MRPIRLNLKGFTAFRDEQEIDFTSLDVFAIAGPTGSGKSSLLDALTYALYGNVERVGRQVSQLVSQGQPRLAVTLEFAVGLARYRITRSTPARGGATKVMLERCEDGEWTQYGEGADRVRECDAIIRGLVGLDYTAFTRSVLLPQGKFAEFLVGDAKDRRDILTELLGLSLFKRMAERSGAIGKESAIRAQAIRDVLDREFAGVSGEALEEARVGAAYLAEREEALAKAENDVGAIAERWRGVEREVASLRECAAEARERSTSANASAQVLAGLAEHLEAAERELAERQREHKSADRESAKARAAREKFESAHGREAVLVQARTKAESLEGLRTAVAAKESQAAELSDLIPKVEELLTKRAKKVAAGLKSEKAARESLAAAGEAYDGARHAHAVADLTLGLKAGNPCPVCGEPLAKPPAKVGARPLVDARKRFETAERASEKAARDRQRLEREHTDAERDLREARKELDRLRKEAAAAEAELRTAQRAVAELLGGKIPFDPLAVIDGRIEELAKLVATEAASIADVADRKDALTSAERARDALVADAKEHRATLMAPVKQLLARIEGIAEGGLAGPELPQTPAASAQPGAFATYGSALAAELERMAADLDAIVATRAGSERTRLREALEIAGDLVPRAGTLVELLESLDGHHKTATRDAATAARSAHELEERLGRMGDLDREVRELEVRAQRFRALALELRADRVIAFLQAEALQVLAAAGSERLGTLSDGRYRLVCHDDEFFVVDTWNGDEERSVRTLSGGETFLASLALALALSEQVRSLSVTERATLDSLFLDEGFGTLDPETLRIVVDAIEQLGGDGRMVGVITHVRELAEQFPRLEVRKSQRGSKVELVV